jgi:hypothetical protein
MQLTKGDFTWDWNSQWAKLPDAIQLGYTHGVAVDRRGLVYVFNQSPHAVVTFEPDGTFAGAWDQFPSDRFCGAHGLTLVDEGGEQFFWLTDQHSGEVAKTTLDGRTVLRLDRPAGYTADDKYSPTWAAQAPDGRVFVADGYGSSRVSVYNKAGRFLSTFDGSADGPRFDCPHGLWIGRRPAATGRDEPLLYITDRGNSRVRVYDLDANFIKSFYQDHPCCFDASADGLLLVPDLQAFVNLYDQHDHPAATKIGDGQLEVVGRHGWPNVPHDMRRDGRFNSPHGGCFDAQGNIYIVEWIQDGRITKLTRT